MVEIARAFSVTDVAAETGDPRRTHLLAGCGHRLASSWQFHPPLRRCRAAACILISHILARDPRQSSDRIVGHAGRPAWSPASRRQSASTAPAWSRLMSGSTHRALGGSGPPATLAQNRGQTADHGAAARHRNPSADREAGISSRIAGEIIGLAGFSGHGQTELPHRGLRRRVPQHHPHHRRRPGRPGGRGPPDATASFPLWSIAENITIRSLPQASTARHCSISPTRAGRQAEDWKQTYRSIRSAQHGQPDPVAVGRQPAEGAVRARARTATRASS